MGLISSIRDYIYNYLIEKVNFDIGMNYYNHILKLPLRFFDQKRVGEILTRIADTYVINDFINILLFDISENIFVFLINLGACLFINPLLTLLTFLFFPIYSFYSIKIGKLSRVYEDEKWEQEQVLSSENSESIFGIRAIKALAGEIKVFRKIKLLTLRLRKFNLKYQRIFLMWNFFCTFFNSIEKCIVFLVGGLFIINDQMSIGEWFAFQAISSRVFGPLKNLLPVNKKIQNGLLALNRLHEIASMETEKQRSSRKIELKEGKIKVENLCFNYNEKVEVLSNVNVAINPGETVALVGRSGAGKTTLINLIAKFYLPTKGSVYIDGIEINDYDVRTLRKNIGMVLQDNYFFYGSIMDNLLLASHGKSEADAIEACKKANVHDFIMNLKYGYETEIGEKGARLSSGEKQRISIAQAILRDPKILILDEATSHLDLETEEKIQNALEYLTKDRTTIVIAHRLSTIRGADKICVIDDGKIVESGRHEELMDSETLYKKLFMKTTRL